MEARRGFLVLTFSFTVLFGLVVFAYDDQTTHPALTDEMVDLYNAGNLSLPLSSRYKELIVQGSIDEDKGLRFLNHFYDPISGNGLLGYRSALVWAQSSAVQAGSSASVVGLVNGDGSFDYSWERAIQEYAQGDKDYAYLALGHVLHLIEDMSVPDHTRNDPHAGHYLPGQITGISPYEDWTEQFKRENTNIASQLTEGARVSCSTLEECFNRIAKYANNNFFSEGTILKDYTLPIQGREVEGYGYGVVSSNEIHLYKTVRDRADNSKIVRTVDDSDVLSDYWNLLSKQAVLTGAGVIHLFHEEGERARALYQSQSWFGRVSTAFAYTFSNAHELTLDRFQNAAQLTLAFVSFGGSVVNDAAEATALALIEFSESAPQPNLNTATLLTEQATDTITALLSPPEMAPIQRAVQVLTIIPPASAATEETPAPPVEELIIVEPATSTEEVIVADAATSTPEVVTPSPPVYTGSAWVSGISLDAVAVAEKTAPETETETVIATEETATTTDETTAATTPEVVAYDPNPVVINEIAWMGTRAQANDEWIELYNRTGQDVDVTGWTLESKNKRPLIALSGIISAHGYFLLERTASTTTDQQESMLPYASALNNSGPDANLYLKNGTTTVDAVDFGNWPFGDNGQKRTMERVSPYATSTLSFNWKTYSETLAPPFAKDAEGNDILGTPGAKNSVTGFYTPTGDIAEDTTWYQARSPYYIQHMMTVRERATLTIESGVVVKFAKGNPYGGGMNVRGTLRAEGMVTSFITLTSFSDDAADGIDSNQDGSASVPASADWMNVNFYGTTTDSVMRYAQIRYGGQGVNRNPNGWYPTYEGVVGVYGANPEISDSVFERNHAVSVFVKDGAHPVLARNIIRNTVVPTYSGSPRNSFGIRIADASSTANILGNIFEQNTVGIFSESATTTPLIVRENTFTDNQRNGEFNGSREYNLVSADNKDTNRAGGFYIRLLVDPGQSKTITRDMMPYIIGAVFHVQAGGMLTIDPGTILKSGNAPYGPAPVVVQGTLLARGTETEPIVFTSTADEADGYDSDGRSMPPTAGEWENIQFMGASSSDSILEYAHVRYGGRGENICPYAYFAGPCMDYKGAVYIQDASPAIVDSVFDNNQAIAVFIEGDSQPAVRRSRIQNTQTAPRNPRETIGGFGISIGAESAPALEDNSYEGNLEDVVYR